MDPYLGEIRMFSGSYAPDGWAFCNGAVLLIRNNAALFEVIKTKYGGDGINTFCLPDLQGRLPLAPGPLDSGTLAIGQKGGSETVILTSGNMPAHTHQVPASTLPADTTSIQESYDAVFMLENGDSANIYNASSNTAMAGVAVSMEGSSQPHNNMQPYLCINFIISMQGYFPG
jgi:microcystin-dependent protein